MPIEVSKLSNANVIFDGIGLAGKAKTVELPNFTPKMGDHAGLGMIGATEVPLGLDKASAKFDWNALYPEIVGQIGDPFTAYPIQVRSQIDVYTNGGRTGQKSYVAHLSGTFKGFPFGKFDHLNPAEFPTEMVVHAAKLIVDGKTLYEVDVLNNIWIVNGKDLLATFRKNLGL